ncbi:MAG: hypothetical protein PVF34_05095 [Gammaproteobacteria bacterium]|jgi:hypothetical protein
MTCSLFEIQYSSIVNNKKHPVKATIAAPVILVVIVTVLLGCNKELETGKGQGTEVKKTFRAPQDGKLTEQQVADYIVIREKVIREVKAQNQAKKNYLAEHRKEPGVGAGFRYFDQIEKSAAQAQGMSYEEFIWVKDTVITTQTTTLVQRYYELNHKIMSLLDKTLNRYEEITAENPSSPEQKKMDGYVDEMKQEMADLRGKIPELDNHPEALAHNIEVVAKFKKELDVLRDQASRISAP